MSNGGIIGPDNIPTTSIASGVWRLSEQYNSKKDGIWPEIYSGITYQNSSTSTSSSITLPSTDVAVGDLCILYDHAINGSSTPSTVVPTGFTSISTNSGIVIATSMVTSYKVLTSGDIGSSVTGMNGSLVNFKIAAVFRNANSSTITDVEVAGSSSALSTQTINTNGITNPMAIAIGYTSATGTSGIDTSPASTGNIQLVNGSREVRYNYRMYNGVAGEDVTYGITTDYGIQTQITFYLTP